MQLILSAFFLGHLTITSYQPIRSQTDDSPGWTSIGDRTTKFGCAVSRDLLDKGIVRYGEVLYIERFGYRVVNDVMGKYKRYYVKTNSRKPVRLFIRQTQWIDLMVFSHKEEHAVGVRKLNVWVIRTKGIKKWSGQNEQSLYKYENARKITLQESLALIKNGWKNTDLNR